MRGPVRLASQASVDALGGCVAVEGDLVVATAAPLDLAGLHGLRRVSGSVVVGPTLGLGMIDGLIGLETIDGDLLVSGNTAATGAYFPVLSEVGGAVALRDNLMLTAISLPMLARVGGGVSCERNPDLERLDLGGLVTVGGAVSIAHDRALETVDLGAAAASATFTDLPALGTDRTPPPAAY